MKTNKQTNKILSTEKKKNIRRARAGPTDRPMELQTKKEKPTTTTNRCWVVYYSTTTHECKGQQ